MARPAAPIRSGMRAPLDSPSMTSGRPRLDADLLHVPDLLHVDDGRRCAEHGEVIGHERDLAAGDAREPRDLPVGRRLVLTSGRWLRACRPDSVNVAGSTRYSMRSRALRKPSALRRASFSAPPIANASASFSRSSLIACSYPTRVPSSIPLFVHGNSWAATRRPWSALLLRPLQPRITRPTSHRTRMISCRARVSLQDAAWARNRGDRPGPSWFRRPPCR